MSNETKTPEMVESTDTQTITVEDLDANPDFKKAMEEKRETFEDQKKEEKVGEKSDEKSDEKKGEGEEEKEFNESEYLKSHGLEDYDSIDDALSRLGGARKQFHSEHQHMSKVEVAAQKANMDVDKYIEFISSEEVKPAVKSKGDTEGIVLTSVEAHLNESIERAKAYDEQTRTAYDEDVRQKQYDAGRSGEEYIPPPPFKARTPEIEAGIKAAKPVYKALAEDILAEWQKEMDTNIGPIMSYLFENVKEIEIDRQWNAKDDDFKTMWADKKKELHDFLFKPENKHLLGQKDVWDAAARAKAATDPKFLKTFNKKVTETAAALTDVQTKERNRRLAAGKPGRALKDDKGEGAKYPGPDASEKEKAKFRTQIDKEIEKIGKEVL